MVDISAIRDPSRRIPKDHRIDDSPLETAHLLDHPVERGAFEIAASFPEGTVLALDLDDTLLAISYRNEDTWDRLRVPPKIHAATSRIQRLLRRTDITIQPRPGVIGAITGWQQAGVTLGVISATAEQRIRFILSRLPFLDLPFASGEKIAAVLERSPTLPRCLAAKTPAVFQQAVGLPPYDLLIDDSGHTAELLDELGFADRLVHTNLGHPNTGYFLDVLLAAKRQLASPAQGTPVEVRHSGAPLFDYPFLRLEDPYYFPLMNLTDMLPA